MAFTITYYRFTFIGGILITFCILSILYVQEDTPKIYFRGFKEMLFPSVNKTKEPGPIVLLWTNFYSITDMAEKLAEVNCPLNCQYTANRSLLNESAAVVFHLRSVNLNDLPYRNESSDQKWILINREPPPHTPHHIMERFEGKIHWTISYRKDSDIYSPYALLLPVDGNATKGAVEVEVKKKRHLVCWIVSHCSTTSRREVYAKLLGESVPVTVYGKCGNNTCPAASVMNCYEHISHSCKFYLSFENSLCKNYVTEKLFNVFKTDMVPIVMGGENYSAILPDHSYINALDYKSPKDLAKYLLELDKDTEKLKMYHQWKTKYRVEDRTYTIWACEICNKLHETKLKPVNVHTDLFKWWFINSECFLWPSDFS